MVCSVVRTTVSQSEKCLFPTQEKAKCLSRSLKLRELAYQLNFPEIVKIHLKASDQRPLEMTQGLALTQRDGLHNWTDAICLAFGPFAVTFITASS